MLIAHRGESYDAPENTLAAFRLAWERKVPAIELDVHLSRDGELLVLHDPDTKRIAPTTYVVRETEASILRQLDVGSWKDPRWRDERIPTLAEALATVPDWGTCVIEIKVGREAVPPLVKTIRASGKRAAQLPIISFKAETIAEVKRSLPQHDAYFLSSFKQDKVTKVWSPEVSALIAQAKSLGVDGLDLSYQGPLTAEDLQAIRRAGLKFVVWTVDDPAVARSFAAWGAHGITTNRAAWLREQLAKSPASH